MTKLQSTIFSCAKKHKKVSFSGPFCPVCRAINCYKNNIQELEAIHSDQVEELNEEIEALNAQLDHYKSIVKYL